jgi:hypothetical protein
VLGEPGMGKSTELRRLAAQPSPHSDRALLAELRDYGSRSALREELLQEPVLRHWQEGSHTVTLFLDGLDEGLLETPRLHRTLVQVLRSLPCDRLRLRLSCRSAEWPPSLEDELRKLWPDLAAVRLMPLGPADLRLAAESVLPQERVERFMEGISGTDAAALATLPDTAMLLLRQFRERGAEVFADGRAALYEKGLLSLLWDSLSRREDGQAGVLGQRDRLLLAARLAAVTLFANRAGVWTGDEGERPDAWVALDDLVAEPREALAAEAPMTEELYRREVLRVGPFRPTEAGGFRWLNQVHAEFLAAWYLRHHDVPAEVVRALVTTRDGESEVLVPQLVNTAAWLADLVPDAWGYLVEHHPLPLLRSDLALREDEDKATLLMAILDGIHSDRFAFDTRVYRPLLVRLAPSTEAGRALLEQCVGDWLGRRDVSTFSRRIAATTAEEAGLAGLAIPLFALAKDATAEPSLRDRALGAALALQPAGTRPPVDELLHLSAEEDPYLELHAASLRALLRGGWWTVSEVFAALEAPRNSHYIGTYSLFVSYELLKNLDDHDVAPALDWGVRKMSHRGSLQLSKELVQLAVRGLSLLDDDRVSDVLVELFSIDKWRYMLGRPPSLDWADAPARRFLARLVERIGPNLWPLADRTALRAAQPELLAAMEARPGAHLAAAVVDSGDLVDESPARMLLELAARFEVVRDELVRRGHDPSDDPEALVAREQQARERLRARHEEREAEWQRRAEEVEAKRGPPPEEVLADALSHVEAGRPLAWVTAWQVLLVPLGETQVSPVIVPISQGERWESADNNLRTRILDAAQAFLEGETARETEWGRPDGGNHHAHAGLAALDLLLQERPSAVASWSAARWQAWAPVVATLSFAVRDGTVRERLNTAVVTHAPEVAARTLSRHLAHCLRATDHRGETRRRDNIAAELHSVLRSADQLWCEEVAEVVYQKLKEGLPDGPIVDHALGLLVRRAHAPTLERLPGWLALEVEADGPTGHLKRHAWAAATRFTDHRLALLERLDDDREWAAAVLRELAPQLRPDGPMLDGLKVGEALLLVDALAHVYPPVSDPRRTGAYAMGPDDILRAQRDLITRTLASQATWDVVHGLEELRERHEDAWPGLSWVIHEARDAAGMSAWAPPSPTELLWQVHRASEESTGPVVAFLLRCFAGDELRRFADQHHGQAIQGVLPEAGVSGRALAREYVGWLRRTHRLEESWFDALRAELPARGDEVARLQQTLTGRLLKAARP